MFLWGGKYVMYYTAQTVSGHGGHYCLSVATASSPQGPFTDTSSGPLLCNDALGGVIDPSPFIDHTGHAWLSYKTYDDIDVSSTPSQIFVVPLNATGLGFTGAPVSVLQQNNLSSPFETVENPQMFYAGGTYYLLFSRGNWNSAQYRQGFAVCAGAHGSCVEGQPHTILSSYGSVAGPGGGSVFTDGAGRWYLGYQGWNAGAGCSSYSSSCARRLYVAALRIPGTGTVVRVPCKGVHPIAGY